MVSCHGARLVKGHAGIEHGLNSYITPAAINSPTMIVADQQPRQILLRGRGGRSITSASPGSNASATSWRPLVTRLIQRSCDGK